MWWIPTFSALAAPTTVPHLALDSESAVSELAAICADGPVMVTGSVVIGGDLESFDDGGCIQSILWDLVVEDSSTLTTVSMPGLRLVRGSLLLDDSASALAAVDFPALFAVGEDLDWHVPNAMQVRGFNRLRSVGRYLTLRGPAEQIRTFRNLRRVGALQLSVQTGLTSLGGLGGLRVIQGVLSIHTATELVSLDGLALETGPVAISIRDANQLTSIRALSGTMTTAIEIIIDDADSLESLEGLEGLTAVTGDLYLHSSGLRSLEALSDLETIGGQLYLSSLDLESMEGLDSLTSVGTVTIRSMSSLTSLLGLESLVSIGEEGTGDGSLLLDNLSSLDSLDGLESLVRIEDHLQIEECESLRSIEGLGALESVGDIFIEYSPLDSLAGLEGLREVGSLTVYPSGAALPDVSPLSNLESIGGELVMANVADATDFSSLVEVSRVSIADATSVRMPVLTRIGGGASFEDAVEVDLPALTEVAGFLDMPSVLDLHLPLLEELGGSMDFEADAIQSLRLPSLRRVGGTVLIKYNFDLESLDLSALESVGSYLTFEGRTPATLSLPSLASTPNNLNLRSLSHTTSIELGALTDISGHLDLSDNPLLSSFSAPSLESVGDDLMIENNPNLSQAEMESWAAGVEVDGSVTITGNLEE